MNRRHVIIAGGGPSGLCLAQGLTASAIDRLTLRQILAARLGDVIHCGAAVTGGTRDGETVAVTLSDGSTATATSWSVPTASARSSATACCPTPR